MKDKKKKKKKKKMKKMRKKKKTKKENTANMKAQVQLLQPAHLIPPQQKKHTAIEVWISRRARWFLQIQTLSPRSSEAK